MAKYVKAMLILITICYSFNSMAISREERIQNRIKPMGSVYLTEGAQLQTTTKPKLGKDAGMKRYTSTCYLCHDTGASGAPKLGNKADWAPRVSKGNDTLYEHSVKGFNAMPAKGGCLNCSDEEIKMTVDYMLQKSK